MTDVLHALNAALQAAVAKLMAAAGTEVDAAAQPAVVQEVPPGKPGDYGSPVAFTLARSLRQPPPAIAAALVASLELPAGVASAEAVGAYINFRVDPGAFVSAVALEPRAPQAEPRKVIVEHTSVNPNKEAHVGHLRNIVLGDSTARILAAVGHDVEVQNYIDDTGRQAAESLFAVTYFNARYDSGNGVAGGNGSGATSLRKYDHWLGELYVRLTEAKEHDGEAIERGVTEVM